MKKINCVIFCLFIIIGFVSSSIPIINYHANYYQEIFDPSVSLTLKIPKPLLLNFDIFDSSNVKGPPAYPLFIPNKINQRPETMGQIEEYNKALAEEEKERQENELVFPEQKKIDRIPQSKYYVKVRGPEYHYKYNL
ncbi:uncharacterized protein LOC130448794 [Diorhabda sublineata]|uniref:uncharacterized protein LOC130448794 n=1 Tax=Diorhabda sublineata TaxID=1163346 RepID=UPI0024E08798|nr:uncharacterized protein LOC130448794 [Diorhabda sublineata]